MRNRFTLHRILVVISAAILSSTTARADHLDTRLFDFDNFTTFLGSGSVSSLPDFYSGGNFWRSLDADGTIEIRSLDAVALAGSTVYLEFDLLLIGDWAGEPSQDPAHHCRLVVDYFETPVFDESFSNQESPGLFLQSFGGEAGELVPPGTGSLVFIGRELSVYHFAMELPVVSGFGGYADVDIQLSSSQVPGGVHYAFGIDNLILSGAPLVDSDGDGVFDHSDNCTSQSNPLQVDSDGDGFGNRCDPDLNNDCDISSVDLGLLKLAFFSANADADFTGDGVVNVSDLGVMRSMYFGAPGPSGLPNVCMF